MIRVCFLIALCLGLAACATPEATRRAPEPTLALPPMNTFSRAAPVAPLGKNSVIARDFLDLSFGLENGASLPTFTRFEGPITVSINGRAPQSLSTDLDRLVARLKSEARVPIRRVRASEKASITVNPVTRNQIRRVAPSAACFVRPNVSSWDEYRSRRNDPTTFWTNLNERRRMAVFLPTDVSPQEMRDCLHEEIAQALGPVNDLYRLSQSIFNDDNFHTVLSGYDMMILRATYDPSLQSGMNRQEVAARLPAILNKINPSGFSTGIARASTDSAAWKEAITTATLPRFSRSKRRAAAERAVQLALSGRLDQNRLGYSYYLLGRLTLTQDAEAALAAFLTAGQIYRQNPDTRLHAAHVAMQIAAFQLSSGEATAALKLVNSNIPVVERAEHAALLSLLLLVKAEALTLLDRSTEAQQVQTEALAWARYGFGDANEVRARAAEIIAISPRSRAGEAT